MPSRSPVFCQPWLIKSRAPTGDAVSKRLVVSDEFLPLDLSGVVP